jgi:hypothetical protein
VDPVSITVGISWTVCGLVSIALAIPLVRGQVARNPLYGVRFAQSFASDDAWLAINRYGGKRLIIWSIPILVIGIASLLIPLQSRTALTLAVGFGPLIFVLIPVLESWRFARRYSPRS